MRVIRLTTDNKLQVIDIENTLRSFQTEVGGLIETVKTNRAFGDYILIVNEEGIYERLSFNKMASEICNHKIVGQAILCSAKGKGFAELTEDDIEWIKITLDWKEEIKK